MVHILDSSSKPGNTITEIGHNRTMRVITWKGYGCMKHVVTISASGGKATMFKGFMSAKMTHVAKRTLTLRVRTFQFNSLELVPSSSYSPEPLIMSPHHYLPREKETVTKR